MADMDKKSMMKAKTLLNEAMKALDDAMASEDAEGDDDTSQENTSADDDDDDVSSSSLKMSLSKYK